MYSIVELINNEQAFNDDVNMTTTVSVYASLRPMSNYFYTSFYLINMHYENISFCDTMQKIVLPDG